MSTISSLVHFGTAAAVVGINSMGVGLGQGLISQAAIEAINIQPRAQAEISRAAIMSMAVTETAAVLGTVIAMIFLFGPSTGHASWYTGIAKIGIASAICLSGGVVGYVSYLPAAQACFSIARQPFFSNRIINIMLITLSLIQTPSIFGFIIALFINTQLTNLATSSDALRLLASGLCIGIGSIGPAIGLARFAQAACASLGINRNAYQRILSFTFLSEAIIETPIIFALLVSLILISSSAATATDPTRGFALLAAGLCTGFCTFGPGIGSGKTAARACIEIAFQPHLHSVLSRTSMVAQGLLDTFAIYGLLVSIMLIFFIS